MNLGFINFIYEFCEVVLIDWCIFCELCFECMFVNYVLVILVSGSEYIWNVINDYVIFVFLNLVVIKISVKVVI